MPTIRTRSAKGSALTYAEVDANFTRTVSQKTTTYQVLVSDNRSIIEGNHASTPFTVTLPTVADAGAAEPGDFTVTVTNINAAVVSVDGSGSETINGSTGAITLKQWDSVTIALDSAAAAWVATSRVGDLGDVDIEDGTVSGTLGVTGVLTASGGVVGDVTGDVTGDLTGNVTGNVTGDVTGNLTGNADTVTTNANLTGGVTSVGNAATVVTNANLTGDVTSVGNATTLTVDAITGQTDIGAAIVDTDELIINDGGAIRRTDMSRVRTYIDTGGLFAIKASDESVISSTTLQDDDDLQVTLDANSTYEFEYLIIVGGVGAADFKLQWIEPDGTFTTSFASAGNDNGVVPNLLSLDESSSAATIGMNGNVGFVSSIHGLAQTGGSGGVFKLQWAQATSFASNTTVYTGSWLKATKLA